MSVSGQRVLVVTGETSGERHMARVMDALEAQAPGLVEWFGSGGPEMARAGFDCLHDVSRLGAIGPAAALAQAGSYLRLYRDLLREADRRRPDLAVLVDFPEFNLRLARSLDRRSIPVYYFISPQVWAWRSSRVRIVRRHVRRMLVIFPFEEEFYRRHGVQAHYVGNPSAAELRPLRQPQAAGPHGEPLVALMPGSCLHEAEQLLPVMLETAALIGREVPVRFRLLRAPALREDWLRQRLENWQNRHGALPPLEIVPGEPARYLPAARCALVKSGTSTLEAMLLGVPFAMVYRMAPLSYRLLKPWVRTATYCLANLVAGREVAPEFVQEKARPEAISRYLLKLLRDPGHLELVKQKLKIASETLGDRDAYSETARHLIEFLEDGG